MGSRFDDLAVYRRSAALADELHDSVLSWGSVDLWTAGVQAIRAADSIGANIAEAMGRRTGRDAGNFEVRVFAGALTGAMMAVYDPGPGAADTVARALDFVDAGMPLT